MSSHEIGSLAASLIILALGLLLLFKTNRIVDPLNKLFMRYFGRFSEIPGREEFQRIRETGIGLFRILAVFMIAFSILWLYLVIRNLA
jgi:hypothetical protein